jgi:hypothetical protein
VRRPREAVDAAHSYTPRESALDGSCRAERPWADTFAIHVNHFFGGF